MGIFHQTTRWVFSPLKTSCLRHLRIAGHDRITSIRSSLSLSPDITSDRCETRLTLAMVTHFFLDLGATCLSQSWAFFKSINESGDEWWFMVIYPIGSMSATYANIGGILMGSMLPYLADMDPMGMGIIGEEIEFSHQTWWNIGDVILVIAWWSWFNIWFGHQTLGFSLW